MTTQPMTAKDFAFELDIADDMSVWTEMVEQRDQSLTAPLLERIKELESKQFKCCAENDYLHGQNYESIERIQRLEKHLDLMCGHWGERTEASLNICNEAREALRTTEDGDEQ